MQLVRFCASLPLLLLTFVVSSCDGRPISTSITRSAGAPTAILNQTGAWSGTATDSLGSVHMMWQVTQTAANVRGTVTATTNVGLPLYTGTITGGLVATVLTFTITVPRGSIVEVPECAITLSGTATDVLAESMAGTYAGTHSCLGAVEGGRFLLIRQ
jgi:hypothetical protein